jgi:hypothetical protein
MQSDNQQQSAASGGADASTQAAMPSRRRLFKGVAGGTGVLLAVHAKTALGTGVQGVCKSPSAMMSGNTSPRPSSGVTCSGGRAPGFWKLPENFTYWAAAGAVPATFNVPVAVCSSGLKELKVENILAHGTLLTEAGFTDAPTGVGLWAALAFPGTYGQLLRHLTAAWLNAGYFASSDAKYPLTKVQIIEMWDDLRTQGAYCPSSMVGCGNAGWPPLQVISYIEGMYDINSNVDLNLCDAS